MTVIGQIYKEYKPKGDIYTIDTSKYPSGIYFIRVYSKTNNLLEVKKMIKN